jgi:hypothetical protein
MINQALNITIYDAIGRPINDPARDIPKIEGISYGTIYPGGLFADADLFIPRSILASWMYAGANRVVIRNGLFTVYEGYISNLPLSIDETTQGRGIHCNGAWGQYLLNWHWRKAWADGRLGEDAWPPLTTNQYDKFTVDRQNRMRAMAKNGVSIANNDVFDFGSYTTPTGETVKRITFSYNLQKGAQSWTLGLWNATLANWQWTVAVTGSGTQDITLATPSQNIIFILQSNAVQAGISDGTIYGEVSNVVVYTETGAINLTEITKDLQGYVTGLSTDSSQIGTNAFSIVPFSCLDNPTCADILTRAASFGDSSYNRWAVGIRESELAADSLPALFAEQWPDVAVGYDYGISLTENMFGPNFSASQDFDDIWNWITLTYTDVNGKTQWITPDDDVTLKNDDSITAWGHREWPLTITGTTDPTVAKNIAKKFLSVKKDPQWRVTGTINVKGFVRGFFGNQPIPTCRIRAGKRIKFDNWINDLSGTGMTFLITATSYTDVDKVCQISIGQIDPLDVILAQLAMKK